MTAAVASFSTDPYRPYLLVGHTLALLIAVVLCIDFAHHLTQPASRDFISFWGAAKLALAGTPALAYDGNALHAVQTKVAAFEPGSRMPFPYPPAYLLAVLPFAALPYPIALALWSLVTMAIYAMVARCFAPQSRWLALSFAPVVAIAAIGQNGFVTAALFLGGLLLLERGRKFLAGLVLGCLIIKPQLALMLPVAMLAGREWRVIAGAAVSATGVLLLGLALFGVASSAAWINQMPLFVEIAEKGLVGWHKFVSIYAALRQMGLPVTTALAVHMAIAALAAALVARVWHSDSQPAAKAAVLGAATMLASPYLYAYDSLVLVPAFAWLVERRAPVPLVAALWLVPILVIAQTAYKTDVPNLAPLLALGLLVLCLLFDRRACGESPQPAAAARGIA